MENKAQATQSQVTKFAAVLNPNKLKSEVIIMRKRRIFAYELMACSLMMTRIPAYASTTTSETKQESQSTNEQPPEKPDGEAPFGADGQQGEKPDGEPPEKPDGDKPDGEKPDGQPGAGQGVPGG